MYKEKGWLILIASLTQIHLWVRSRSSKQINVKGYRRLIGPRIRKIAEGLCSNSVSDLSCLVMRKYLWSAIMRINISTQFKRLTIWTITIESSFHCSNLRVCIAGLLTVLWFCLPITRKLSCQHLSSQQFCIAIKIRICQVYQGRKFSIPFYYFYFLKPSWSLIYSLTFHSYRP